MVKAGLGGGRWPLFLFGLVEFASGIGDIT